MGRPLAIHDEDIDIDYPLDVDDEHWETGDPARDFVQPADKPSRMSGFIASLKLMQINGYCLRTVYCINKCGRGVSTGSLCQTNIADAPSIPGAFTQGQVDAALQLDRGPAAGRC
jgi:hypothetical protein